MGDAIVTLPFILRNALLTVENIRRGACKCTNSIKSTLYHAQTWPLEKQVLHKSHFISSPCLIYFTYAVTCYGCRVLLSRRHLLSFTERPLEAAIYQTTVNPSTNRKPPDTQPHPLQKQTATS